MPDKQSHLTDPVPHTDPALSLAQSMVVSSDTPLLLLGSDLVVIVASLSFCRAFGLDPQLVNGKPVLEMGSGEWNLSRLKSLLTATGSGGADIDKYEMDLVSPDGGSTRCLELSAHVLAYDDPSETRMILSVVDTTDARAAAIIKDGLIADKVMLMRELQHRIANSLQIIASVLMQSARRVTNDETRDSLQVAHNRVLSVNTIQKHLTSAGADDVELRPYFTQLCQSIGASMIAFPNELSIAVDCEDVHVSFDTSISLGLIVTELVINSLKHAFPDDAGGKITVSYKTQAADWSLSVIDDGIGMPAGTSSTAGAVAGLGTSIIEALARQLRARTVIVDAHPGTSVSIVHESSKAIGSDPLPLVEAI